MTRLGRYLTTVILAEVAAGLAMLLAAWGSGLLTEQSYRNLVYVADHERRVCAQKHDQLLRQIRREGLWRRLGMDGQPWLQ